MKGFFAGVVTTIVGAIVLFGLGYFFPPGQPKAPKVEIFGQVLYWYDNHTHQFGRDIARIVSGTTEEEVEELVGDLPRELRSLRGLEIERYTVISRERELSQTILFDSPNAWLAYMVNEDGVSTSFSGPVAHEFRLRPNQLVDIVVVGTSRHAGGLRNARDYESHFSIGERQLRIAAVQNYDILANLRESGLANYFLVVCALILAGAGVLWGALSIVLEIACTLNPKLRIKLTTAESLGRALAVFETLSEDSTMRKDTLEIKEKMLDRVKEPN